MENPGCLGIKMGRAPTIPHKTAQSGTTRGDFSSRLPVQTDTDESELSRVETERMHSDAAGFCSVTGQETWPPNSTATKQVLFQTPVMFYTDSVGLKTNENDRPSLFGDRWLVAF